MDHTKTAMFPQRTGRKSKIFRNVLFLTIDHLEVHALFFSAIDTKAPERKCSKWSCQIAEKPGKNWQAHAKEVCAKFDGQISRIKPEFVVMGLASIAHFDTMAEMGFLVGGLAEVVRRHEINKPVIIKQSEWTRGQPMPVIKKMGNVKTVTHALALAAQGLLFEETL